MKVKSKVLTFSVIFCLLFSFIGMASAATDISDHWARETIEQCLSDGIVTGMPDGSFQPNKNITRAEFATMVNKAFEFKDADTDKTFSDVKADAWYAEQVAIAAKAGYIAGFPNGTFQPQKQCTRAEACVMIRKAAGLAEGSEGALSIFKDRGSIPAFAKGSVSALVSENMIKGYLDGTFGPRAQVTRAESLVMVYRTSTGDIETGETVRVTGVELDKASLTISVDNTTLLKATIKPTNATNKEIEWTTSNEKIALVDEDGLVKGISVGKATITATSKDGAKTATCNVNVTSRSTGGGGGGVSPPAKTVMVTLADTAVGIGKNATVTVAGYAGFAQYLLRDAVDTALTGKINIGETVVVLYLNDGDTVKVELYQADGTLLDTVQVVAVEPPAGNVTVTLTDTAVGIGKLATVKVTGYADAAQYLLKDAVDTSLTGKINIGETVVVLYLNDGDTVKVELYQADGTLLNTITTISQ